MYEFFKVVVQPVMVVRENGNIVREQSGGQVSLYTKKQVIEFLEALEAELDRMNEDGEEEQLGD